MTTANDIRSILPQPDVDKIIKAYDPKILGGAISGGLARDYPPIAPYLEGIGKTLYPEFDAQNPPSPLSPANRERCLVALLASRSRAVELAIHAYMAIANGVPVAELAHIAVAAGAYTGVDTVGIAFGVLKKALIALKDLADKNTVDPGTIIVRLLNEFK